MWKQAATMENRALYVAEEKSGIVGFSVFAPPQDKEMNEHGELGAIYLLEKFKGKKIGAALLSVGMKKLIEWKYSKAYCWVLQDNPTKNLGPYSTVWKSLMKSADRKLKNFVTNGKI
jgi:GNAT superfamily N-acetyltransferase